MIASCIACSDEQNVTNEVVDISTIQHSKEVELEEDKDRPINEVVFSEEELLALEKANTQREALLNGLENAEHQQELYDDYKIISKNQDSLSSVIGIGKIFQTTINVVSSNVFSREYTEITPASFQNNFVQRTTRVWTEASEQLGDNEHNIPALSLEGFYNICFELLSETDMFHYHLKIESNILECGSSSTLLEDNSFTPQIKLEIKPIEEDVSTANLF